MFPRATIKKREKSDYLSVMFIFPELGIVGTERRDVHFVCEMLGPLCFKER